MQSTREWLLRCLRLRLHRLQFRQTVRERVLRCLRLRLDRLESGQAAADDLYARGKARERGRGVAKNILKAVDHYADAAELGLKQAWSALGSLAKDKRHTYAVMRACIRLARLYARDRGGAPRNFRKAADLLVKAAEHAPYLKRAGERSRRMLRLRALVFRRRLAKAGDAEALRVLAGCYAAGREVRVNIRKAVDWLTRLAERSEDHDRLRLGELWEQLGLDEKAADCFRSLTRSDSSTVAGRACAGMGRMCEYGRGGVERSVEEALKWRRKMNDRVSAAELFWRGGLFDPALDENRAAFLDDCRVELHNLLAPERARLLNALRQAAGRPPAPSFRAHVAAAALPARYAAGLDMLERILKEIPSDQLNGWEALPSRFGPDGPVNGDIAGWRKAAMLEQVGLSLIVGETARKGDLEPEHVRKLQQLVPNWVGKGDIMKHAPPLLQGLELLRLARLERALGKHDDALQTGQAARKPLRIALAAMVGYAEAREQWREDAAQGQPYAAKRLDQPLESLGAMQGAMQGDQANLDFDMMAASARTFANSYARKSRFNF